MKILMASDIATIASTMVEQYMNHNSVSMMTAMEGATLGVVSRVAEDILASYMPASKLSKLTTSQKNEFLLFTMQALYTMMRYPRKSPWLAGMRIVQADLMGLWSTQWMLGADAVIFETGADVPGLGAGDGRSAPS